MQIKKPLKDVRNGVVKPSLVHLRLLKKQCTFHISFIKRELTNGQEILCKKVIVQMNEFMPRKSIFSETEAEFFRKQRVARMATIDPNDGFPHVVPICFAFNDVSFYTTLSKNSKRLRNIENGSTVSLLIDEYEERAGEWLALKGLLVKCGVNLLNYYENRGLFMNGWCILIRKYSQYKQWASEDSSPKDPDKRLIMQMLPLKKTSWGFTS